jgi:hypothetical protein
LNGDGAKAGADDSPELACVGVVFVSAMALYYYQAVGTKRLSWANSLTGIAESPAPRRILIRAAVAFGSQPQSWPRR